MPQKTICLDRGFAEALSICLENRQNLFHVQWTSLLDVLRKKTATNLSDRHHRSPVHRPMHQANRNFQQILKRKSLHSDDVAATPAKKRPSQGQLNNRNKKEDSAEAPPAKRPPIPQQLLSQKQTRLVLPALTDCRWWFESLLVHSGVSSATRRKATGAVHKKDKTCGATGLLDQRNKKICFVKKHLFAE